jgi:hypothetical protein
MEITTYNEQFNDLWDQIDHRSRVDRQIMGNFLMEMIQKDNLIYIGEGHRYGHPFSRIPVSSDGEKEYIIFQPKRVQMINYEGKIEYITQPGRKLIVSRYDVGEDADNERYIEWGSMSDELDFYSY